MKTVLVVHGIADSAPGRTAWEVASRLGKGEVQQRWIQGGDTLFVAFDTAIGGQTVRFVDASWSDLSPSPKGVVQTLWTLLRQTVRVPALAVREVALATRHQHRWYAYIAYAFAMLWCVVGPGLGAALTSLSLLLAFPELFWVGPGLVMGGVVSYLLGDRLARYHWGPWLQMMIIAFGGFSSRFAIVEADECLSPHARLGIAWSAVSLLACVSWLGTSLYLGGRFKPIKDGELAAWRWRIGAVLLVITLVGLLGTLCTKLWAEVTRPYLEPPNYHVLDASVTATLLAWRAVQLTAHYYFMIASLATLGFALLALGLAFWPPQRRLATALAIPLPSLCAGVVFYMVLIQGASWFPTARDVAVCFDDGTCSPVDAAGPALDPARALKDVNLRRAPKDSWMMIDAHSPHEILASGDLSSRRTQERWYRGFPPWAIARAPLGSDHLVLFAWTALIVAAVPLALTSLHLPGLADDAGVKYWRHDLSGHIAARADRAQSVAPVWAWFIAVVWSSVSVLILMHRGSGWDIGAWAISHRADSIVITTVSVLVGASGLVLGQATTLADLLQDSLRILDPDDEPTTTKILNRIADCIHAVQPQVVLAHSQGTLLVAMLSGKLPKTSVVLCGSPLRSIYETFLPACAAEAKASVNSLPGEWVSYHYDADYVGRAVWGDGTRDVSLGFGGHLAYFSKGMSTNSRLRDKLLTLLKEVLDPYPSAEDGEAEPDG